MAFSLTAVSKPLLAVDLGLAKALLAVLPLASNISQIVFRPIFGSLSDRKGRRHFIIVATLIYLFSYLLQAFARTAIDVIVAGFIVGIGVSMLWPCLMAYASEIGKDTRNEISLLMTFSFLGSVIGYVFSGVLAEVIGWRSTFIVSAFIVLVAFFVAYLSIKDTNIVKVKTSLVSSVRSSIKIGIKTTSNVSSIGLRPVINTYMPVIVIEGGYSQSIAGFVITGSSLIFTGMQRPSSILSKKKWFSSFVINTIAIITIVLLGLTYELDMISASIVLYFTHSALSGLLPSSQLVDLTENTREKGSSAGGFGLALSFARLLGSTSATIGGMLDLSISSITAAIDTAGLILILFSLCTRIIGIKT